MDGELTPFQRQVQAYVAANPVTLLEGAGEIVASRTPHHFWPESAAEQTTASIIGALERGRGYFVWNTYSSPTAHLYRVALLDLLGVIVQDRRGNNAEYIRRALPELRNAETQGTPREALYRQLDESYKGIAGYLGQRQPVDTYYSAFAGRFRGGNLPADERDFVDALILALRLRLGESAPGLKVKITGPEVILVLGRREFRANTTTLELEAIPYPLPEAGQRWTDPAGTPYLIAAGNGIAVNLKTGVPIPLEEGVIPGSVLGESFYKQ